MKRVKNYPNGQVPTLIIVLFMLLSVVYSATLSRRDRHIFELAQNSNDNNNQNQDVLPISFSNGEATDQLLGAILNYRTHEEEGSRRNQDEEKPSSDGAMIVYTASQKENHRDMPPKVTRIIAIEEEKDEPSDLVNVQRSWLDRNPKSRNLIATGIMGSAIAYALTSVRKASHMDPVPDSVKHALAIANPVAKTPQSSNSGTMKATVKRETDFDLPSFVKRAEGRWRAGALGAALGGFGMYVHSNKLMPDIKESLWTSPSNDNETGKRSISKIIYLRDDNDDDDYDQIFNPQKRAGGRNLAYPLYATSAAVGLYALHKSNNDGFQTPSQTAMQKRSVIPEESEREDIQLQRRSRGWKDVNSLNARISVSPSHKQVKVYWTNGKVARFDRQADNPNGANAGDEQGKWRPIQSFGAKGFLPKDSGQVKIIWKSGNITMYDRNGGGQGGPPASTNNNNSNSNGPQKGKTSDDFGSPNGAFTSLRMSGHQCSISLSWLIVLALTAFLTIGNVFADERETIDGLAHTHNDLEKRQFNFRRANTSSQGWVNVHHLNAESKISPTHSLVKVIWHSGNVTTYNRTEGQNAPVLPASILPDDEPVMWRTVKSYNAKAQLSGDHEQLRVIWNSGNLTNFIKLPPNPAPTSANPPGAPSPSVQSPTQTNSPPPFQSVPIAKPNTTDNDFQDNQSNNATLSGLRRKTGGSMGLAGLLLFWCVFFLFPGDVLADGKAEDGISIDLAKRSNVLAAQTSLVSIMPVMERSRLQADEAGETALIRRGPYATWTALSTIPAKSFISPKHDQLKMIRMNGNGPEIFIRDQDTNGPRLPTNFKWQRLRDINAKAKLSPDETMVAVRWSSGSITEYIRREVLRKRSFTEDDLSRSGTHHLHRRHSSTELSPHEHTARDFQLGRVSPQSHHVSYDNRMAQAKHHKNSAGAGLGRKGLTMEHGTSWFAVVFAISLLFFGSISTASAPISTEDDPTSVLMEKRSRLAIGSSLPVSSLSTNTPLHFNSVQVNTIPHSSLGVMQGYKGNVARKALRESPPSQESTTQAKPPSQKSRLRQKRGPGKLGKVKRGIEKDQQAKEALLVKRSVATMSNSFAPSGAPASSPALNGPQSSTAWTQDNWPDGQPGKPSKPRNSVAIHDQFARQYGRKGGIDDSRRELKGGKGGGSSKGGGKGGGKPKGRGNKPRGRSGGDSEGGSEPCSEGEEDNSECSGAGRRGRKNAALMAGGAAVGTALALHVGGGGGQAQRKGKSSQSETKKSRLRKKKISERSLQIDDSSVLLVKRAIPDAFTPINSASILKRSVVRANQAVLSLSNQPSLASNQPSSHGSSPSGLHDTWSEGSHGKPKDLPAYHANQRSHYDSLSKSYPAIRQSHDDRRAVVRDGQLPSGDVLSSNRKVRASNERQIPRSGTKSTTGAASAGLAVVGFGGAAIANRLNDGRTGRGGVRGRRIRQASRMGGDHSVKKRFVDEIDIIQDRLETRINPPTGKMEKAILIGTSTLLAGGGLVGTKTLLQPGPNPEKRTFEYSMDGTDNPTLLPERSPAPVTSKNLLIGLGAAGVSSGLTLHALQRNAEQKDKGYGVGKIPDQVW